MQERVFKTELGDIHYWVSAGAGKDKPQLVFLPGLTADHRLFEKQIEYFEGKYPLFVWDAPGHAASWPFELTFCLMDKAKWLDEILVREGFGMPVIIGQSMGGYVGQAYSQLFPDKLSGFVSVDSAPLQREYVTSIEIALLKKMAPVYRHYPWKSLLKTGTNGVATSEYGRKLMREIMMTYDGDQEHYASLAGHGYKILAEAMEADLPYEIKCPALLICGEKDRAGSCIRYNKAWHNKTGIPIEWIAGAGHNSNTDAPETVNRLIEGLVKSVEMKDFDCVFRKENIEPVFGEKGHDKDCIAETGNLFSEFMEEGSFSREWALNFPAGRYVITVYRRISVFADGQQVYKNGLAGGNSFEIVLDKGTEYYVPSWGKTTMSNVVRSEQDPLHARQFASLEKAEEQACRYSENGCRAAVMSRIAAYDMY